MHHLPTFSGTRFAAVYFLVQGVACIAWWSLLFAYPSLVGHFLPREFDRLFLMAFMVPDFMICVFGSLAAGMLILRSSKLAIPFAWVTGGGMLYAAAYCAVISWNTDSAWWSVLLMVPAAFFSLTAAGDVSVEHIKLFRVAQPTSTGGHLLRILLQLTTAWTLFLAVMPFMIRRMEDGLDLSTFHFSGHGVLGVVLFLMFSTLGVGSSALMAVIGKGTPVPFNAPTQLIIVGPYRFVRNPMAIAGIGQGLAIGIGLGSYSVIIYSLVGALVWQFLIRPAEERDLLQRFGEAYEAYRRTVSCWIPRKILPKPTEKPARQNAS